MSARIMIVEDESIVAADIKVCLEGFGYQVPAVVACGEDAITKAAECPLDLVLMDIHLPGALDGIDAAARLTTEFDLPVVYLTAFSDDRTLDRAKVTAPFGYILKPYKDRDLYATVEMALNRHELSCAAEAWHKSLTAILQCIGDAVVATDTEGRITYLNPIAEVLAGMRLRQARNRCLTTVLPVRTDIDRARTLRLLQQVVTHGIIAHLGTEHFDPDFVRAGHITDCEVRPLRSQLAVSGTVLILRCSEGVSSAAAVDTHLYQFRDQAQIDFNRYVEQLLSNLLHSFDMDVEQLSVNLAVAPGQDLEIETAYACGLIINELVTIALQNAFPAGRGNLHIEFSQSPAGDCRLTVADDGNAYHPNTAGANVEAYGMKAVQALVGQLGGSFERAADASGNRYVVSFSR